MWRQITWTSFIFTLNSVFGFRSFETTDDWFFLCVEMLLLVTPGHDQSETWNGPQWNCLLLSCSVMKQREGRKKWKCIPLWVRAITSLCMFHSIMSEGYKSFQDTSIKTRLSIKDKCCHYPLKPQSQPHFGSVCPYGFFWKSTYFPDGNYTTTLAARWYKSVACLN